MSKAIKRAASDKDKKKRRRGSESQDSDELMEELEAEAKLKDLKKKRKARKEEAEAVERKIEEHDARIAAGLKELARRRNESPVMLHMNSNALYIIFG
jgi:hypothetical protein